MNKPLIIILLMATLGIWACDTPGNVPPVSENFFIKWYAGVNDGNQFGNDIIATSDGGLLIAGTSVNTNNTSEILLIKTDAKGNEIWTFGAAGNLGAASISEGKSVIELTDSYLIGGSLSLGDGSAKKSILMKISFDGILLDTAMIDTDEPGNPYFNQLSKITLGTNGILVSGETMHPSASGLKLNGFVRLYDESSLQPKEIGGENIWYFGLGGDDYVAGAYEVASIGAQNSRYLIFGSSDHGDPANDRKFYYVGYDENFTSPLPNIDASALDTLSRGDQTAAYVTEFNDTYWVIGDTDISEMFLIGWQFVHDDVKDTDWSPVLGSGSIPAVVSSGDPINDGIIGKGVAVQAANKYVIVGDASFTTDHKEIYLARVGGNFRIDSPPWPKTYGTPSSAYSASAVTILPDGSIIIVGTADLEPIKKIIVIKTGPNGEMSF